MADFFLSLFHAFWVGGLFCVSAQLFIDFTRLTPARILVLYVCFGVFLGAVGLYEPLYDFAGCGISVPLIGFGGTVARGVRASIHEMGLLGVLVGPLSASAGGISAALLFGYLVALCFQSKPKRMDKK